MCIRDRHWVVHPNGVSDHSPVAALALVPYLPGTAAPELVVGFGVDPTEPNAPGRRSVHVLHTLNGTALTPSAWRVRTFNDIEGIPRFLGGSPHRVYIVTEAVPGQSSTKNTIYLMDPQNAYGLTSGGRFGSPPTAFTTIDWDGDDLRDPVVAFAPEGATPGGIHLFSADSGDEVWHAMPGVPGRFSFSWQVPYEASFGVHIVETQIRWALADDLIEEGAEVFQVARLLNTFIVVPPGQTQASPSPAYSLEVISWLEHWG